MRTRSDGQSLNVGAGVGRGPRVFNLRGWTLDHKPGPAVHQTGGGEEERRNWTERGWEPGDGDLSHKKTGVSETEVS